MQHYEGKRKKVTSAGSATQELNMPRPPNIQRPIRTETSLPEDIRTRLELLLWSEVENRVPQGAMQRVIVGLLREYLDQVEKGLRPPL